MPFKPLLQSTSIIELIDAPMHIIIDPSEHERIVLSFHESTVAPSRKASIMDFVDSRDNGLAGHVGTRLS